MSKHPYFFITLKAGIGRTFQEAEIALTSSKSLKEQINPTDSPQETFAKIRQTLSEKRYAISQYLGPTLEEKTDSMYTLKQSVDLDVSQTLRDQQNIIDTYGRDSPANQALQRQIEKRCLDQTTGAFTHFGYHFTIARDINNHRHHPSSQTNISRYRIIIDGNDMHYWNDQVGYDTVTERLRLIGLTIVSATRKTTPERVGDLVFRQPLVSRMHGSAGDEFFLDMYSQSDYIETVIHRLFDKIYLAQLETNKNLYKS
jgi:hypothetical protein